jgi:hypothetical protein
MFRMHTLWHLSRLVRNGCACLFVLAIASSLKNTAWHKYESSPDQRRTFDIAGIAETSLPMKTMHVCSKTLHLVPQILRDRGFATSDAWTNITGWGLILGGYQRCGNHALDDGMTCGLNALLFKHARELPNHSVYHSCLGCRESICSKRKMCILAKWHGFEGIASPTCYIAPAEHDALLRDLDTSALWVMKRDERHNGNGVKIVNASHIQKLATLAPFDIVQKYVPLERRPLRVYVSITSSYPFRAHVYCHVHHLVLQPSEATVFDICQRADSIAPLDEAGIILDSTALASINTAILKSVELIVLASIPSISSNLFNRALQQRRSRCYTFWSLDLALTADGRALAYEVNEFPSLESVVPAQRFIITQAHAELFNVLGLRGEGEGAGMSRQSMACLESFIALRVDSIDANAMQTLVILELELAAARVWHLLVEEDPLLPENPAGSMPWAQREYREHRRAQCRL